MARRDIELREAARQRPARAAYLAAALATMLALVTALVARESLWALWLLVVLVAVVFMGSRRHLSLGGHSSRLSSVRRFTKVIGESLGTNRPVTGVVLEQCIDLLGTERAELTLVGSGGRARTTMLESDGRLVTSNASLTGDSLEEQAATSGSALLAPAARGGGPVARLLDGSPVRDAMVAPMRVEDGVMGTLTVANRLGELGTFTPEDLAAFEAIANHAAIAIQNDRLAVQLRQEAAEREHRALHDSLTGLPNRVLFTDRVAQAIAAAGDSAVAVLLVDLDRFKEVNDALGHQNGDALLREVAARLLRCLGDQGTVARLAGDEFGILLPEVGSVEDPIETATRLKDAISRPFALEELTFEMSASVGVAHHPTDGTDAATLLQRADVAKYAAKQTPGETKTYSPDHDKYTPRRLALVGELRQAIEGGELTVYYQPIVALETREVVGVEALLRWPHRRHGFLPPDEFVPIAEHTGLIKPLTDFVLQSALSQVAEWHREGLELAIAVNMSVRSLLDPGLPGRIESLLRETGVRPHFLTLELTESSIMADLDNTIGSLSLLSAMGVSISVDDFGTGYSSLSYLQRLPVDEVKIDKSFILHMSTDTNDAVIVRSTVNLARNLGLRVLAEGVEDPSTWDRLQSLGCDLAQGYLISRALPPGRFENWLRDWPGGVGAAKAPREPSGAGLHFLRVVNDEGAP